MISHNPWVPPKGSQLSPVSGAGRYKLGISLYSWAITSAISTEKENLVSSLDSHARRRAGKSLVSMGGRPNLLLVFLYPSFSMPKNQTCLVALPL